MAQRATHVAACSSAAGPIATAGKARARRLKSTEASPIARWLQRHGHALHRHLELVHVMAVLLVREGGLDEALVVLEQIQSKSFFRFAANHAGGTALNRFTPAVSRSDRAGITLVSEEVRKCRQEATHTTHNGAGGAARTTAPLHHVKHAGGHSAPGYLRRPPTSTLTLNESSTLTFAKFGWSSCALLVFGETVSCTTEHKRVIEKCLRFHHSSARDVRFLSLATIHRKFWPRGRG